MYRCFYEGQKFLDSSMQREEKKNRDGENVFFKALANRFCGFCDSWSTFYQMDFMKR